MAKKTKKLRLFLYSFSFIVIAFAVFGYWALGKSLPEKSSPPIAHWPNTQAGQPKALLTAMTYNIGHGQGVKDLPWDWRDAEVTKAQLKEVANVINHLKPDFILLQEVDLDSHRTHRINQAEFLLGQTHYPYSACAIVWDKNYIPFPYWPIKHHIGKVLSSNCIFSKYPLKNHESIIFAKPESNAFWYNWGYIDRGVQKVVAQIGNKTLTIFNTHLEAWEKEARNRQVKIIGDWINSSSGPVLFGGDLNSVPPEACQKNKFGDEPEADFSKDSSIEALRYYLGDHDESLTISKCPSSGYNSQEFNTFTFPSNAPTRRLDYFYTVGSINIRQERVVKEAGTASDHLPVWIEIEYR